LVEGFADPYAIEQLAHLVGSGRVDPPEPISVAGRGHGVDATFIKGSAASSALETIIKSMVMVLGLPARLVAMLLAFTLHHMDGRVQDSPLNKR
jgi:hypothetical protein